MQFKDTRLNVLPTETQISLRICIYRLIRVFSGHSVGSQGSDVSSQMNRTTTVANVYEALARGRNICHCAASCADPEGMTGGPDPAPIPGHHKAIGFLSNTCPESLKNRKATKPAFNVLGHNRPGPFSGIMILSLLIN